MPATVTITITITITVHMTTSIEVPTPMSICTKVEELDVVISSVPPPINVEVPYNKKET